MSDLNDILDGKQPEPVQAEQQEQPVEATPEVEEAPQVEEPKAQEPQAETEPKDIPYAVFKSTRDDYKAQLEELKRVVAEAQRPKPEPVKPPDMYEDPEGYQRFQYQQTQNAVLSARADLSEIMAAETHGQEAVDAAFEAAKAAGEVGRFINSKHPYGDMVKWHKQQQVVQEIGTDPVAYREKIKAEIMAELQAGMVAKQANELAAKAAPSMANVNGSGGVRNPGWQGPTPLSALIGE